MKYFRAFELKILAPTNHRGTRLKIMDLRSSNANDTLHKSVILNWDYSCNTIVDQAQKYFKKIGIKIHYHAWDFKNDKCFLMTNDFTTQLKKERG